MEAFGNKSQEDLEKVPILWCRFCSHGHPLNVFGNIIHGKAGYQVDLNGLEHLGGKVIMEDTLYLPGIILSSI